MKKVINNTQKSLTRNEEMESTVIRFPQKKELAVKSSAPVIEEKEVKPISEKSQELEKRPTETLLQKLDRLEKYHKRIHYYLKEIESFQQ